MARYSEYSHRGTLSTHQGTLSTHIGGLGGRHSGDCAVPRLRRDSAHLCHNLRRDGAPPCRNLRCSLLPGQRRDWAHRSHICAGTGPATGPTPATSAPGLASQVFKAFGRLDPASIFAVCSAAFAFLISTGFYSTRVRVLRGGFPGGRAVQSSNPFLASL